MFHSSHPYPLQSPSNIFFQGLYDSLSQLYVACTPGPSRPRWFTQPRARSFAEFCTLHIGYMVKLHIWSILSRSKVGSSLIKLIGYMVYGLYGLFWMDKTVDHGVGFSWPKKWHEKWHKKWHENPLENRHKYTVKWRPF